MLWTILSIALWSADQTPYNLVAIVTDDQSSWSVGCYGNKESRTPNMDRLAAEGARLSRAFVVTPVCSPSRAAYLTGRYGTELGITDFINTEEFDAGVGLPAGTLTWPAVLRENGYQTCLIGKWHLGGRPHQLPEACGFDEFVGAPKGSFEPVNPIFVARGKAKKFEGYSSNVVGDEAVRFLEERRKGPFALLVHFREPHTPYTPVPPEDSALFEELDPTVPTPPGVDVAQVKRWTREYYAAIHAIDRNVGKILAALEELGIADRTIVSFTSDHGYNIGHHGLHTKGNAHWIAGGVLGPKRPNMFDTSLRIPWIVRWPGVVKGGMVVDDLIANIDTFATVLGMLGISTPDAVSHRGMDFSTLLRLDPAAPRSHRWRDAIHGQYDLHNKGLAYMRMIRTDRWKLVRCFHANDLDELYDLQNDPGETNNLYTNPAHASIRGELDERLIEWMKSIGDPLLR